MSVIKAASQNPSLRRIFLPLLKRLSFDFSKSHPWVPTVTVRMNSFLHKGYWFSGKTREAETMELFAQLIKPGDHVVEVGGHIGFITAFFSYCVGPKGKVTVFEPGSNNLGYISKNIMHPGLEEFGPIFLIEAAIGPESGEITFYEDGITGQNNSVIPNFSGLESNAKMAFVEVCLRERKVEMVALDSKLMGQPISFVKIDVEGFEMGVLSGMKQILIEHQPIVMVEIQADHVKIFNLFQALGYSLFSEFRIPVLDPMSMNHNNFALHGEKHSVQIQSIFEVGT